MSLLSFRIASQRPAPHGAGLSIPSPRQGHPALARPYRGHISSPPLIRRRPITRACQPLGGHRLAMPTVGRHRTTRLGTFDGDRGLSPQPPRFGSAHGNTLVLEGRGQASTPSAGPRLRRERPYPRHERGRCRFDPAGSWPRPRGITPAATALPPLPPFGYRPPPLVLGHHGRPERESWAQQAAAGVHISRARRRRLGSSRRR